MAEDNKQNTLQQELEEKISSIGAQRVEEEAKNLATKLGLPYLNLAAFPVGVSALSVLDENESRMSQVAVIVKTGNDLKLAAANPESGPAKAVIERLKKQGYTVSIFVVSPKSLDLAWDNYKIERKAAKSELGNVALKDSEITELQQQINNISDLKTKLPNMSVTQVLNLLIAGALKVDASDIHLEPEEEAIRLRYRIDGVLQDVIDLSKTDYPQLLSRIKLTSGLKINVHDIPQDGRFTISEDETEIEIRTSVLPGAYGENVVMRLLDPRRIRQKLEDLGMREDTLELIKSLLKKTTGAIITTGPTGAGKTTTLYAFINQVNSPDIKVITIEDPIEYHIQGISQTQVDEASGYTFANGLRSIVRQDPDVILVGEIRDAETADIAMQASLTGHLVFTTLHTNDSAGAIPRLIDFNIKPITIAPAVNAAMAQRLVRRLCQSCKKKQKPSADDLATLLKYLTNIPPTIKLPKVDDSLEIYYPQKCAECNLTGYRDRIGVYEVFVVDPEMEKLIITSPSITEIKNLAIQKGMTTMIQDGLIKAVQGMTSVEEVLRVVGE